MESEEKSKNSLGGIGGSKEMCTTPPHPNLSFAWFSKHIATISLASSMQPATSHRRMLTLMRPSRGRLWLNDLWAFCYTKCCWPFVVWALFSSLCNLLLFAASFLNAWIFHLPQESEKVNKIPLVLGYFQQQKKRSVRGIFLLLLTCLLLDDTSWREACLGYLWAKVWFISSSFVQVATHVEQQWR